MKKLIILSILFFSAVSAAYSQGGQGFYTARYESTAKGDSILHFYVWKVYVTGGKRARANARRSQRSAANYNKLIYNVRKVYPIALEARRKLAEVEAALAKMPSGKQRDKYVKQIEQELKDKYTPVLKEMTFSQGKILIKLIDRETDRTTYQLVREIKSGFSAFMWQGMARLFGANLKQTYDAEGDDRDIEEIIQLYEMGII